MNRPPLHCLRLQARFQGINLNRRLSGLPIEFTTGKLWNSEDSALLYNVPGWGAPYFSVADEGTLLVRPRGACTAGAGRTALTHVRTAALGEEVQFTRRPAPLLPSASSPARAARGGSAMRCLLWHIEYPQGSSQDRA